jgi:ubiquinone/menaquinone biosynthesis C-methylase UbiE
MNARRESRSPNRSHPDHDAALEQYRKRAPYYDIELALFEPIRREAIERLAPKAGNVVLDVGCGTGLSLPMLREAVGARGRVVGIEQSPEMLARARECVRQHRWRNVTLIEASVEAATIEGAADSALFHFTHDILRTPAALANIARHLKPGATVVASGLQWTSAWYWPLNLLVLGAALHSVTSLSGLDRPWSHLAKHLDRLKVDSLVAGAVFVATGVARDPTPIESMNE